MPQVAFRPASGDAWVWLREHEITEEAVAPYRRHTEFRVFGTIEEMTRLQQRLEDLGVRPGDALFIEDPDANNPRARITVEIRATVDEIVLRTVAKIAFNYLAHITQEMPSFVLLEEFDEIRNYIRYGTAPNITIVRPSAKQILVGDTHEHRITRGHIVTVVWPEPRENVKGQVSLFNNITYNVRLSSRPPGIWWELVRGHHFDIEHHVIDEVSTANRFVIQRP